MIPNATEETLYLCSGWGGEGAGNKITRNEKEGRYSRENREKDQIFRRGNYDSHVAIK